MIRLVISEQNQDAAEKKKKKKIFQVLQVNQQPN